MKCDLSENGDIASDRAMSSRWICDRADGSGVARYGLVAACGWIMDKIASEVQSSGLIWDFEDGDRRDCGWIVGAIAEMVKFSGWMMGLLRVKSCGKRMDDG